MAGLDGSGYFNLEGDHNIFSRRSNAESVHEDEVALMWAGMERLPSQQAKKLVVLKRQVSGTDNERTEMVDVTKLGRRDRSLIVKKALATSDQDNYKLLAAIKERFDRVGLEIPEVEVRFENLNIEADVLVGSRALPSLVNYTRDIFEQLLIFLRIFRPQRHRLSILKDISGSIKPRRMTLLLGPPGAGKSTLLLALAGKLDTRLKKSGKITYNGHELHEFCAQRTSAYISQTDSHIAELTVRETLDFGARCEGEGFAAHWRELSRLEKQNKIRPSPEIDAFMKASSVAGKTHSISTDYILKVLGLDVCSETVVGNDMLRGISGGQRKRVTTGEMVVGPRKTLFMDEISTGLDSSTTYQIVKCIRNFVHLMDATVLMALLQPAPETFDLFDDLILLSEGHMVYQGPREEVLNFFESLGFHKPLRKGTADFLQEVTSRKDQAQYWADPSIPYEYIPVSRISEAYKKSIYGRSLESSLSVPFDKSRSHLSALRKSQYGVSKWKLFEACFQREWLLIKRHSFLYIFKTVQVAFVAFITCTLFIRTRIHPTDMMEGGLYLNCLFFALVHMMFNGFAELPLMIFRLPVFYKQRDNNFYPAWAWSVSSWILRVPYSIVEAVVWSVIVYYSAGFSPSAGRFFRHALVLFAMHQMALGLFRTLAAVARNMMISNTFGSAALLVTFLMGGFIMPKDMIKSWWIWGFWVSPLSYAQRAISVNEFDAIRWMKNLTGTNTTLGYGILEYYSLPTDDNWYWLGVCVVLLYAVVFNIIVTLALAYLSPLKNAQTVLSPSIESGGDQEITHKADTSGSRRDSMTIPFKPLSMTFHNINYYVDMPKDMNLEGVAERKLQLLSGVSGVFRPGVLTALMGSSGAGKTTLMDVLAGRKTGGYIEGEINISGFPKEQSTFARVSGYVEQNDIHSPQVTVMESLLFSAFLRLPADVNEKQRREFVEGVMKLVELDNLRDALVGLPGVTGLSTEQRKRLTIAVELVANPSIIFMDEPTSGLDARAAAIVMRTVRNTVNTGRTVVCTIHQPSIEIFEAFDELLLLKRGGRLIYGGKVGEGSEILIKYFESINGILPIAPRYNPANWMLEMTTPAIEERIGQDFAVIYKNSDQYRNIEVLIQQTSTPQPGSQPLEFSSTYSQSGLSQFRTCLWKQNLVYWRSPEYNAVRLLFTTLCALIVGSVFWDVGSKRNTTENLMVVMGALYTAVLFLGVNNASTVQPVISIERTVFYRERAAGMYSAIPYAIAQGLVEIPYIVTQTIVYGITTYFMINFERTARKIVLYLVFMFLTFTYFTFYGMVAIGLTPSQSMAAVVSSAFYSLWNLFSGFLLPKPKIPGWWIWFYYICPVAWTLQGLIGSQLGDVEEQIVGPVFQGTVKGYLKHELGIESKWIGVSAVILLGFSFFFFLVFALSLKYLNFQKR